VGASTDAVFRGRERLALILAILSPLLGALLSAGGWLLAGAALRPVRRMSQEADAISLAQAGRRLPHPEGEDEIAQLGRTLNAMLDRIEAAFARERMFLDDASHELRTPIAVLRAELEVALLESGDREALERSLRSALEEAERLARLAEDLRVRVASDGDGVLIVVADDGPGFPDTLLPVVFDRFTRAEAARSHEAGAGAGLGLAIVAAIVRAHGGTISAANGPPLGGAAVVV